MTPGRCLPVRTRQGEHGFHSTHLYGYLCCFQFYVGRHPVTLNVCAHIVLLAGVWVPATGSQGGVAGWEHVSASRQSSLQRSC